MTPEQFIAKWRASSLKESAAKQEHFIDLCRLLGEPTPAEADPTGDFYTFERGATKATGGDGFADVWKRACFGWEYKGKGKSLEQAYAQLLQYAGALENPPLLVVSDMEKIIVRTNWTNAVRETHAIELDDLLTPEKRDILKAVFADPERLKPGRTRQALTEDAASEFADIAQRLRDRGYEPQRVAHFVNRLDSPSPAKRGRAGVGAITQRRSWDADAHRPPKPAPRTARLAHRDLDAGVAAAYGRPGDISDDDTVPSLSSRKT